MSILSPEWSAILYLVAAVCFILALKGLSSPKARPPRQPDRRGRRARRARDGVPVDEARQPAVDPRRDRGRLRDRRSRVAPGQDDPDAAARRAVQRRRRRRGGPGRAARAAALREDPWSALAVDLHGARRRGLVRRLVRHLRQAAGAHDDPAGDLPGPAGRHGPRARRCARRAAAVVIATHSFLAVLVLAGPRPRRRRAARAAGRRRRRADRHLAAQRLHRSHGRGVGARARQHRCCSSRARSSAPRGTILTRAMAAAMGRSVTGIMFGALQGRLDGRLDRGVRPAGQVVDRRGRRDPARLRPAA